MKLVVVTKPSTSNLDVLQQGPFFVPLWGSQRTRRVECLGTKQETRKLIVLKFGSGCWSDHTTKWKDKASAHETSIISFRNIVAVVPYTDVDGTVRTYGIHLMSLTKEMQVVWNMHTRKTPAGRLDD